MAVLILVIITNKTTFIFGLLGLFNSILNLSLISLYSVCFNSLLHAILFHSLNLCHSAICFLGQFMTSFQWCNSWPELFPPISSRPITSFLVILSQSMTRNSMLMFCKPSLYGMSKRNDSLNTGFRVRFLTCVFFLAILWLLYSKYIFTIGSETQNKDKL